MRSGTDRDQTHDSGNFSCGEDAAYSCEWMKFQTSAGTVKIDGTDIRAFTIKSIRDLYSRQRFVFCLALAAIRFRFTARNCLYCCAQVPCAVRRSIPAPSCVRQKIKGAKFYAFRRHSPSSNRRASRKSRPCAIVNSSCPASTIVSDSRWRLSGLTNLGTTPRR